MLTGALDTFIVYNERKKVTSSAKRKRKPTDKSLHQACEANPSIATDKLNRKNILTIKLFNHRWIMHVYPMFMEWFFRIFSENILYCNHE